MTYLTVGDLRRALSEYKDGDEICVKVSDICDPDGAVLLRSRTKRDIQKSGKVELMLFPEVDLSITWR